MLHRRVARSACTSRSRRPGARPRTSPTTSCRWATAPSGTTCTRTRRTTAQWIGFRQPVLRAARERLGETVHRHARGQPRRGVGRERVLDRPVVADRSRRLARHPPVLRVAERSPGTKLSDRRVLRLHLRELGARPAGEGGGRGGLTPLRYMRRYGAFEIRKRRRARVHEEEVPPDELRGRRTRIAFGRVYTRAPKPRLAEHRAAAGARSPTREGRRPVGVEVDGSDPARLPDAVSGKLEFYSRTLARLGLARVRAARLHQEPRPSRASRSRADAAHLDVPAADADPHPQRERQVARRDRAHEPAVDPHRRRRAARRATGDLVRVETEIGHFVVKAWVTEGIRPGVVACSHHMGRWKLARRRAAADDGDGRARRTTAIDWTAAPRARRRAVRVAPTPTRRGSGGPTSGVHQNLTFPVQPDPVSGMHCWHQAVRVRKARPERSLRRHRRGHRKGARPSTSSGWRRRAPRPTTPPTGGAGRTG